jgi:DNA-binding Xre family transcriptional regulator
MSTTVDLVQALKNELKSARMTYADLARSLDMAESSVKRMLAKSDMPLSRVDAICRALKIDFAELARRVADAQPLLKELTQEQEKAVVKDKKLLLVAISVLSQWTLEQIVTAYRISEAECIGCLAQDFAQQHQTDQKLSAKDREGYTLLLGMRNWEFELFTRLRRA